MAPFGSLPNHRAFFQSIELAGARLFPVSPVNGSNRDHFPYADFPGLICTMPNWITSESLTTRPDLTPFDGSRVSSLSLKIRVEHRNTARDAFRVHSDEII